MITIHDLLEDSRYKEFFLQVPKAPATLPGMTPPWVLYVRFRGEKRWRKKEFSSYAQAFKLLKRLIHQGKVHDAAINNKRQSFPPPMRLVRIKGKFVRGSDNVKRQATKFVEWSPKIPGDEMDEHKWCPYCRRPTVFKWYSRHHALPNIAKGVVIDASVRRCCICGASERIAYYNRPSENGAPRKRKKL